MFPEIHWLLTHNSYLETSSKTLERIMKPVKNTSFNEFISKLRIHAYIKKQDLKDCKSLTIKK